MERYHPKLELAPRDVVARAMTREGMGETPDEVRSVYLDMRHVQGIDLHKRFPGISTVLAQYGLDLCRDLIPARPAAHYLMGGIRIGLNGRTSLRGLYAAGEAACTGVHGANRLASNSLLEGLVFGARAAQSMLADALPIVPVETPVTAFTSLTASEEQLVEDIISKLQAGMWTYAGLLRQESTLREGFAVQEACAAGLEELAAQGKGNRRLAEAQGMCRVAHAILHSAMARTESRGAHYRNDFPTHDDEHFLKHSILGRKGSEDKIIFEEW
jgi:L-aspartate oxidase